METIAEKNPSQQSSIIKETRNEEEADVFKTVEIDLFPVTASP